MSAMKQFVQFLVSRPAWQIKVALIVAGVATVGGYLTHWEHAAESRGARRVQDSLALSNGIHAAVQWTHTRDSIRHQIDTQTVTLTRILRRTDTLLRQVPETIRTPEDTAQAIAALPALKLSADAAIRACSEYQSQFFRYQTACDSLDAVRRTQLEALRTQLGAVRPGKFQTVLKWVEIGAAGYVGFRLGRGR